MSCENPEPKKWRATALGMLLLSFVLMGCLPSTTSSNNSPISPLAQASPHQSQSGQSLPISAQAQVSGQTIDLEVAQTPQQQAMGLMYRAALADNHGMLFPFNPPQPVSFWMKNVPVPLDMIFLQDGKVVEIAANVPPCTTASCPVYGPETPINQVIELRSGRAAELELQVGDSVLIRFFSRFKT